MFRNSNQKLNAIEINDLISDAIANAAERRRSDGENEANLPELSDEESKQIAGGKVPVIIMGFFPTDNEV